MKKQVQEDENDINEWTGIMGGWIQLGQVHVTGREIKLQQAFHKEIAWDNDVNNGCMVM